MQAPHPLGPRRRQPAVEVASHTKSLEIALQRPCDNRWPPGRPKARKVVPKAPKKEPKSHKCPPKGASDMTFCQTGRPSENMRRRVRIACPDPPEVPLIDTFSTKRVSKSPLGKLLAKRSPELTKSCAMGATRVPQGPPKWHLGSPKITPKSHSGTHGRQGLDSRALGGTPRAKMTSKRDPEASKKPKLKNTNEQKNAGIPPCFGRHLRVRFASRV